MCASRHAGECTGIAAAGWRQGGGMPDSEQKGQYPWERRESNQQTVPHVC